MAESTTFEVRTTVSPSVPFHRSSEELDLIVLSALGAGLPCSAYDIARIAAQQGASLSTTQACRVLNRLIKRGRVMRIETLNAYVLASADGSGFVVCRRCRTAQAVIVPGREAEARMLCKSVGFSLSKLVVEATGLCQPCMEIFK